MWVSSRSSLEELDVHQLSLYIKQALLKQFIQKNNSKQSDTSYADSAAQFPDVLENESTYVGNLG